MDFRRSFLMRRFSMKEAVMSQNVGCFLTLPPCQFLLDEPQSSGRNKQGFETLVNDAGYDVRPCFTIQMIASLGDGA